MLNKKTLTAKIIRRTIVTTLVVSIATIGSFYFFDQLEKLAKENLNNKKQIARLNLENSLIGQLENSLASTTILREKMEKAVPKIENLSPFIDDLNQLAKNTGLQPANIRFAEPIKFESFPAWSKLTYTITVIDNKNNLADYLEAFAKLPYLTTITGIEKNNSKDSQSIINLKAILYAQNN